MSTQCVSEAQHYSLPMCIWGKGQDIVCCLNVQGHSTFPCFHSPVSWLAYLIQKLPSPCTAQLMLATWLAVASGRTYGSEVPCIKSKDRKLICYCGLAQHVLNWAVFCGGSPALCPGNWISRHWRSRCLLFSLYVRIHHGLLGTTPRFCWNRRDRRRKSAPVCFLVQECVRMWHRSSYSFTVHFHTCLNTMSAF